MDKQKLLFKNLKDIEGLSPNADLMWSKFEEAYKLLQIKIVVDNEKNAYEKILNESIKGVIHSILVMIDGGDALADNYLINEETKESSLIMLN